MLYPTTTATRTTLSLNGIWDLQIDGTHYEMAVPASFNDLLLTQELREYVGDLYYQRTVTIPRLFKGEQIRLRFGSVTHQATVYWNGQEIGSHTGGFLPFELDITDVIDWDGVNQLTVKVNNVLDNHTLPVGNKSEQTRPDGTTVLTVDENFDFFNYAGIHRPVTIYTVPTDSIEDITLWTDSASEQTATIRYQIATSAPGDVQVQLLDADGICVADAKGANGQLIVDHPHRWWPGQGYLYHCLVTLTTDRSTDQYQEPFGIRTVNIQNGQFLINDRPFYFKGFGKHEDAYVRGKGLDEALNLFDLNLMISMGANSFRTSHYPYSEEMMRLADQKGIVIINEIPAVGLFKDFGVALSGDISQMGQDTTTWQWLETQPAHRQAIREHIARDKNHASVVMWNVANEAAQHQSGAHAYFEPLVELYRTLDRQQRPVSIVTIQNVTGSNDLVGDLVDVIGLNRYDGWYQYQGDLEQAEIALRSAIESWIDRYPGKPILFTEYGVDTIPGLHSNWATPYSEEFQEQFYAMYHRVFDDYPAIIGEQLWNFADFETKTGLIRVQGNKKGLFTRAREPKSALQLIKRRWLELPHFLDE